MRGRGFLAAGLVITALTASAGSALGAVTIGSNLTATASDNFGCNAVDCTITNVTLPTASLASGLISPVNGTVTSWSFKSGSATPNPTRLRVLRPVSAVLPPVYTGAGTSAAVPAALGVVGPNPTSLPIKAGDTIGLNAKDTPVEANTP